MKRTLLVVGPLITVIGMVGLQFFGAAIVEVVTKSLTIEPGGTIEAVGIKWQRAAYAGMLLVMGCAATSCALVMRSRECGLINRGKTLFLISGILALVGTVIAAASVNSARQSLLVIAHANVSPRPEEVQAGIGPLVPRLNVALGILGTASLLSLFGGLGGLGQHSTGTPPQSSILGKLVCGCSLLLLLLAAFGLVVRGSDIPRMLTNNPPPKPGEIGNALLFSLQTWIGLFAGLGVLGVLQAVAAAAAVPATKTVHVAQSGVD